MAEKRALTWRSLPRPILSTAVRMLWDGRLPLSCQHCSAQRREACRLNYSPSISGSARFTVMASTAMGLILSRKVSRAKLLETIKELAPKAVAMEACASAHFWGRRFLADGRRVLLINPWFVKPFVKGSKNDAADAEAIYEAALRPTMRFVPVKSTEQQDLQSLHRARERVVCARTALINHMRGLLGEYGVILPQGAWRFLTQAQDAIAAADLSDLARESLRRPAR